jgi:hypothetical protein
MGKIGSTELLIKMAGIGNFMWVTTQEVSNSVPTDAPDINNVSQFKSNATWSNVVTILIAVIPLFGTLATTILGAIVVATGSNETVTLIQTIVSAVVFFLMAVVTPFNKVGIQDLTVLAPGVKQYIRGYIAGVPLTTYP